MRILRGRTVEAAIVGIYTLLQVGAVVAVLSIGKDICIPLALAALLTFLLAPLVTRLERWIGRIAAVLVAVIAISGFTGVLGYVVAQQVVDLTVKLPDYQANIQAKLRSFQSSSDGSFSRFTRTIEELRKDLPGSEQASSDAKPGSTGPTPVAVRLVEPKQGFSSNAQVVLASLINACALAGLVLLLSVFMLMRREDLRGRMIRLIGQGRISVTTHAMADAGSRVARYLVMQLIVNATYGIPVAIGLYLIGVPNALLWGALAIVLRFIPYVGPWIAAAVPVALSLAVSDGWTMPMMTIGLFVVLEIVSNNVMEPWLYGTSTGVSSLALILAAVFWAWLWGPIGLVLATPLTVCLVVMGRHVPKLAFLSVLFSDEEPLAPHQECYHRLLRADLTEGTALVDAFLKSNSLTALYDTVLIPVLATAEADHGHDELDTEQRASLHQGVRDILDDLIDYPLVASKDDPPKTVDASGETQPAPTCRVLCLPVRAIRDELAASMLAHVLKQQGFDAEALSAKLTTVDLVELVVQRAPEAVCISVVAPSAVVHARHICGKLHARLPKLKIVVGMWGADESAAGAAQILRASGADEVSVSVADAVAQFATFAAEVAHEMTPAPIPRDETARIAALTGLALLESGQDPRFDRITAKLARVFDVPIALLSLVDRDRLVYKSAFGLPAKLAGAGCPPRSHSVCGHVIAKNDVLVIEDLARDVRFAHNPWLIEHGLRFYAGVPIRAANGQPIGSLCMLDTKPRALDGRDARHLQSIADELTELLKGSEPLAAEEREVSAVEVR
ncbi:MAG: AI-2E family transporter [Planctomycetes bacterium]|nr:AI-2E family transporter [Planctomycetota bacterium]